MSSPIKMYTTICGLIAVALAADGFAQSNQVPFGARPAGMGDAFVAVADDGNALYWNPAGIATLGHHEFNSMNANSFGFGLKHRFLSYIFPLSQKNALGLAWFSEGFSDVQNGLGLDFGWDIYQLSYGRNLMQKLSLGLTFKYATFSISEDDETKDQPNGVSLDIGALYTHRNLKFGLMLQDAPNLSVEHASGFTEKIKKRTLRFGAAYESLPDLLLAGSITLEDRIHFGAEYWGLGNRVAVRVGVQRDIYDSPSPETIYSAGASLQYSIFQFDFSHTIYPTLPNTNRFSVSLAHSFSRSKVLINEFQIDNLFASRYRDYSHRRIGTAVLENLEKVPVEAQVNLFIEKLMDEPQTVFTGTLRPLDIKPVLLTATLAEKKIGELNQDDLEQAVIEVSYTTSGEAEYDKKGDKTTSFFIYAPGAVSWVGGPAAAASFITPNDPVVENFAKGVLKQYEKEMIEAEVGLNLLKAAVLFDALGQSNIQYQEDTQRPFSKMAKDSIAIDDIRYPRQMLQTKSRAGDCDDLTVLMCSLLEAVNVETAVALAPGHLYLFLNSGIKKRSADRVLADPELLFADSSDEIWVPLEMTLIGRSFKDAVKAGAEHKFERFIKTRNARQSYEPAFPIEVGGIISPPDRASIDTAFKADLRFITTRGVSDYARKLESHLKSNPDDPTLLLALSRAYHDAGQSDKAIISLQRLLALNQNVAEARFLLGLIYREQNDLSQALSQANRLKQEFSSDARGYLLAGMIDFSQKQYQEARDEYDRAKATEPSSPLLAKYNIPLWIEAAENQ